jgi:hypothetical protein
MIWRIYFDTQPLRQSQWPNLSTALENLFEIARFLEVQLVIPQPVLDERRAQWFRDLEDRIAGLKGAHGKLSSFCKAVGRPPSLAPLDLKKLERDYDDLVERVLTSNGIEISPVTDRPAKELFVLALTTEPPFADKGTGFKDAVILDSIVDHLTHNPANGTTAIISGDGDFGENAVRRISGQDGLDLVFFKSVENANEFFHSALTELAKEQVRVDRAKALAALERKTNEIATFIRESVSFRTADFGFWGAVVALPNMEIVKIRNVTTPLPWTRQDNEFVPLSCRVEVLIQVEVKTIPLPPPQLYKVGDREDSTSSFAELLASGMPQRQMHEVVKVIDLDCTARVVNQEYGDVEFVGARLSDSQVSQWEIERSIRESSDNPEKETKSG